MRALKNNKEEKIENNFSIICNILLKEKKRNTLGCPGVKHSSKKKLVKTRKLQNNEESRKLPNYCCLQLLMSFSSRSSSSS
jgi:F0F1-type ATP synthase delta subunit